MIEYKFIKPEEIKRAIVRIKARNVEKNELLALIENLSKCLESKVLSTTLVEFPGGDYTISSILATSHAVLSTYTIRDGKWIEIDVGWCSRKELDEKEVKKKIKKILGGKLFNVEIQEIRSQ